MRNKSTPVYSICQVFFSKMLFGKPLDKRREDEMRERERVTPGGGDTLYI